MEMTRSAPNKRKLTEGFLKRLKPREKTSFLVWDEYTRGLSVRVEPTGATSWMVYYRSCGKPRWYRIGSASSIELKDARKLAGRVLFQVAEGKDPQAERKPERNSGTFEELATRYAEEYSKVENKSWRQADALVRRHLLPKWAKMRAANITRGDVKDFQILRLRKSTSWSNCYQTRCKNMYAFHKSSFSCMQRPSTLLFCDTQILNFENIFLPTE
jgi:hypothetical protein